jgi:hypothetical protein
MSQTEIAWAAGFFDGEGCTSSRGTGSEGRWWYINVQITQVERSTLDRFRAAVGVGTVRGPYTRKEKSDKCHSHYRYDAHNEEAKRVIELLWPYLSDPKRAQHIAALERVRVKREELAAA